MSTSDWLICCGCLMMMGSGGSTFQADTGFRVGGMPVTRTQSIPPNVGGFFMGLCMFGCGYMASQAGI